MLEGGKCFMLSQDLFGSDDVYKTERKSHGSFWGISISAGIDNRTLF
tara:strand:+ start:225 stop:365 length:141 start_codon:yes stop_codon:yes gene_type:complete